jgi:sirohydrochlorin ferrochelatase
MLLAVHGTQSADGVATLRRLRDAVAARRPAETVELCFLDVLEPSLATALHRLRGPVVIVPALLSTGFHVRTDIPAVVAEHDNAALDSVRVSRHLGPSPLLSSALADRLAQARGSRAVPRRVLLVGSGSSDPDARAELEEAAEDLSRVLGRPVDSTTLTGASDAILGADVEVCLYLLAEGFFAGKAHRLAIEGGSNVVSAPIGDHPDVVSLIWQRHDEVGT